jgi:hypothetical protein
VLARVPSPPENPSGRWRGSTRSSPSVSVPLRPPSVLVEYPRTQLRGSYRGGQTRLHKVNAVPPLCHDTTRGATRDGGAGEGVTRSTGTMAGWMSGSSWHVGLGFSCGVGVARIHQRTRDRWYCVGRSYGSWTRRKVPQREEETLVDRLVVRAGGGGSRTGKPKLNSLHTGVSDHGSGPRCICLTRH